VITIGDLPMSMTGDRSCKVSKGRFGNRLGLTPWVSNTSRNVVPLGSDMAAACVPIVPDAPPRFSITIVVLRSASSKG